MGMLSGVLLLPVGLLPEEREWEWEGDDGGGSGKGDKRPGKSRRIDSTKCSIAVAACLPVN